MVVVHIPNRDKASGRWTYPSSEDVLGEVGIQSVVQYVQVRRAKIAKYIMDRPIFALCAESGRRRGSTNWQFWWEQSMDLDTGEDMDSEEE